MKVTMSFSVWGAKNQVREMSVVPCIGDEIETRLEMIDGIGGDPNDFKDKLCFFVDRRIFLDDDEVLIKLMRRGTPSQREVRGLPF